MLSGPLKKKKSDSERQEVTVNFVVHEGVATMGDSLEGAVGKLWDLESLGIKASDEVHKLFEGDISFIDEGTQSSCLGNRVTTPFPVIMQTVCHA